jgi:hypothetical protein
MYKKISSQLSGIELTSVRQNLNVDYIELNYWDAVNGIRGREKSHEVSDYFVLSPIY